MCSSQSSIDSSLHYTVHISPVLMTKQNEVQDNFEISKSSNSLRVQSSDERTELIRSNKMIMKRNLRNSIRTKTLIVPLNPKEESLTAASLKDSDSDQYKAFKKITSLKCVSSTGSQKSFKAEVQEIVEQSFEDKYYLIKKIGEGAHSTVYKSLCKVDNKLYAIKKIKNVSFQNFKKMKNLYRMVKSLNHQNIIKFHQFHFDQKKKTVIIVMQYCEFADLRSEIQKRQMNGSQFTKEEILSLAKKIAQVLKYLHSEGICHRDLKPQNILYNSENGEIRVIDLDVCGVKRNKSEKFDLWTNTGTLYYRAPQSFEIGYSQKADIWSLGAILYQLIVGQVPFQTDYEKDFIRKIRNQEVDFSKVNLGPKIKMILRRCLQRDPKLRISASQLLSLLQNQSKDDSTIFLKSHQISAHTSKCKDDFHMGETCLGGILKHNY